MLLIITIMKNKRILDQFQLGNIFAFHGVQILTLRLYVLNLEEACC